MKIVLLLKVATFLFFFIVFLQRCFHGRLVSLRARPKAERVLAEYENFLKLSDRPTDRDAFQRLISFEPSYRLTNGFRHLKATFNKSFVLA